MGEIIMGEVLPLFGVASAGGIAQWKTAGYKAVDDLVERLGEQVAGKDFEEISELLFREGKAVTNGIFAEVIKSEGAEFMAATTHVCQECGRTLCSQGIMSRKVESRHGVMRIERPYFYCKPCKQGYFPFDEAMGIAPGRKQHDLERAAAELFAELPHERAAELFEKLTGIRMTAHCMHELSEELGEVSDQATVLPSRKQVEAEIEKASKGKVWRPILVAAVDGAHVPTRPEAESRSKKRGPGEWREAKGFRIYLIGQDKITQLMSWHQIVDDEQLGEALKFAATLIPQEKVRVALLADGAKWIWTQLKEAFPKGKEILDYYHCSERVHKVADLQYPKDQNRQALWVESTMARLNEGEVEAVIWGLQRMQSETEVAAEEIRVLIGYLRNNSHRIDYKAFKRGQYPRGSGGVESANKFICHVRMKRSGAWWYVINGNAMLRLRCSLYNGTFDDVFAKYKRRKRSSRTATTTVQSANKK
jgi:hypothetical protein